jgi:hypothetical protein
MRLSSILASIVISTAVLAVDAEQSSATASTSATASASATASSSATDNSNDGKQEIEGWSHAVYDTLYEFANWAKVSYCAGLSPIFRVGSLALSCPTVKFCRDNPDYNITAIFKPSLLQSEISGTAIVAAVASEKRVYVVFRGSISLGDWTTDVLFKQCKYAPILGNKGINASTFANVDDDTDEETINSLISENSGDLPCADCKVHAGIYVALAHFMNEIEDAIKPYSEKGYQVVVTGYTYMAGLELQLAGYNPLVVSYASLRVGNPEWNVFVDEQFNTAANEKVVADGGDLPIPSLSRVYQKTDVVPRLPPNLANFPNYTHSGLEFMIDKVTLPQPYDVVEYRGKSDNYINEPFEFDLSDIRSITIAYQHNHNLVRLGAPCNDWDSLFRKVRREEGVEEFFS